MSGNDPTPGYENEPKGFKGLGHLTATQPRPAPPATDVSSTPASTTGAKPPQVAAAPVTTRDARTPTQTIQPPGSSGNAVIPPPTQGTSRGTVIGWLVVLPAILFGIGKCASDLPSNTATTASADQQDAQAPSGSQVPSIPPPKPAYIATVRANIRATASSRSAVVAQLPQWTEISVSGVDGAWSHISYTAPSGAGEGYVLSRLLQPGSALDARVAYCEVATTVRPSSGEVLLQAGTGSHSIKVNAGASDALIKLRQNGKTELAFFVRANETGVVANLADGTYQFMFATGDGFSRKCLEFVSSMHVSTDPTPGTFQTWQEPTEDGVLVHSSSAEYTLTQQIGGNFKPQDLDPGAFRE
jgi:hypothetical protein